jgi:hypothetical protein
VPLPQYFGSIFVGGYMSFELLFFLAIVFLVTPFSSFSTSSFRA